MFTLAFQSAWILGVIFQQLKLDCLSSCDYSFVYFAYYLSPSQYFINCSEISRIGFWRSALWTLRPER